MKHETVLKKEAVDLLITKKDGIYVDATLGGGGHSEEILKRKVKFLYCFDQDDYAIKKASSRLDKFNNFEIIKSNFRNMKEELNKRGIEKIDGILFDLGMSSFQIDDKSRGFSYMNDAILDMRMDQNQELTAKDIINNYEEIDLSYIFHVYGEEEDSRKIARMIVENRPINTTLELVNITDRVKKNKKGHSAKKVFQALRIAVNDELNALLECLRSTLDLLNPGGRLSIITFHSLEDRIVKHFYRENSKVYIPKNLPIQGDLKGKLSIITKKPIYPSIEEVENNIRSHSAKLRVAERNY